MKKRGIQSIFIVSFVVFILLFSYVLTTLSYDYSHNQQLVMNYLDGNAPLSDSFNKQEKEHLEDVKGVMFSAKLFFILTFFITGFIAIYFYKNKIFGKNIYLGALWSLGITVLLSIFGLLSFDLLFDVFHRIFFEEGTWVFPAQSLIIQIFPIELFMQLAKSILTKALFLSIGLAILGYELKRRNH